MPRGVFNWTFDDVVRVLKDNGFHLSHIEGSHHFYIGRVGDRTHQVCVAFHGKKAFKPRTFKGVVAQSGLSKRVWGI